MNQNRLVGVLALGALVLVGGGCISLLPMEKKTASSGNRIEMSNKKLLKDDDSNDYFTIDKVVVDQPAFVVIRNELNAKPMEILGTYPLKVGETTNIKMEINRGDATAQQYVELYSDTGISGAFDAVDKPTSFEPDIKEQPMLGDDGKPVVLKFLVEVE